MIYPPFPFSLQPPPNHGEMVSHEAENIFSLVQKALLRGSECRKDLNKKERYGSLHPEILGYNPLYVSLNLSYSNLIKS